MSNLNLGNPTVAYAYQYDAKGSAFNKLFYNILAPGIYNGGGLSFNGNAITVSAYDALFPYASSSQLIAVHTTSSINLSASVGSGGYGLGNITTSLPYIAMYFIWTDSTGVYPDYGFYDASILNNAGYLILGKATFSGSSVSGFDYSDATYPPVYSASSKGFNIRGNTESSSASTGSLIVNGGVGVSKRASIYRGATIGNLLSDNVTYIRSYSSSGSKGTVTFGRDGGPGYSTNLGITNETSGATNPSKYFRINSVGSLEVVNNAYNALVATLTDAGEFFTSNTLNTTNRLTVGYSNLYQSGGDCKFELNEGVPGDGLCYIDFHSSAGVDFSSRIMRNPGVNGIFDINQTGTGALRLISMSSDIYIYPKNALIVQDTTNSHQMTIKGDRIIGNTSNLYLDSNDAVYLNYNQGGGGVRFCNGSQGIVGSVDAAGSLVMNGVIQSTTCFFAPEGTGTNGGYGFYQDGSYDTGMYSPGDGILDFYANGVKRLTLGVAFATLYGDITGNASTANSATSATSATVASSAASLATSNYTQTTVAGYNLSIPLPANTAFYIKRTCTYCLVFNPNGASGILRIYAYYSPTSYDTTHYLLDKSYSGNGPLRFTGILPIGKYYIYMSGGAFTPTFSVFVGDSPSIGDVLSTSL